MLTRLFFGACCYSSRETKMGGGARGTIVQQFFWNSLPKERGTEHQLNTHYQKLYYSVLPRIATALELGKVLMYVCSIIIVDILPLSLCCWHYLFLLFFSVVGITSFIIISNHIYFLIGTLWFCIIYYLL